jgi:hypothetical protein
MPEPSTSRPREEIAQRGATLYAEGIEQQVASAKGQVVAIDVLPGDFSVAANAILAVRDLRTRQPNAVAFGVRIGSPSYHRIGRGPKKVK